MHLSSASASLLPELTDFMEHPNTSPAHKSLAKIFLAFFSIIIAGVVGYYVMYYYIYNDVGSLFSFSSFQGQVISNQMTNDVTKQLQEQGFDVSADNVTHLNQPASTSYRANVIEGYDPEELEADPGGQGFYFYDETGNAYYLELDEEGDVDPDSIIPLIQE